ncbi:MAG: L-ribulose-5-phosphate 4-epimerase AraD [Fimbriimonadaceae bacterium]
MELRKQVCLANRRIGRLGLAPLTWGNASAVDREEGTVLIKPSGADYGNLLPEDIVVVRLADGTPVGEGLRASSDTAAHAVLYRAFGEIGGIVHTHSRCATAWAQACRPIPVLGTTHADHFFGEVPVTRSLTPEEIAEDYVGHTGRVIVETFEQRGIDPLSVPGVLVAHHGPFVWGETVGQALDNAVALEEIAVMALDTLALDPNTPPVGQALLERHFRRKHGPGATYGQK